MALKICGYCEQETTAKLVLTYIPLAGNYPCCSNCRAFAKAEEKRLQEQRLQKLDSGELGPEQATVEDILASWSRL